VNKLTVKFEFVGNGDCIIIEWIQEGSKNIGIVDCNRSGEPNPVVQRLREEGYDEIGFVVMSHPHHDHFSGLLPVLKYCISENVSIGFFAYTTREVRAYLESIALSNNEQDDLADIFRTLREMEDAGLLEQRGIGTDQTRALELGGDVKMEFLAPSERERDRFAQSLYDETGGDVEVKDKPKANLVSSVLMIHTEEWQLLLTSDAEKETLQRVGLGPLKHDNRPLRLGQIPHHGAKSNYNRSFWRRRSYESETPAAISVGPNGYGHPSPHTIEEMQERLDYEVHTTGAAEGSRKPKISGELDMISDLQEDSINRSSNSPTTLVYQFDPDSTDLPDVKAIPVASR
jgi:beta-lactamase superfamily II metal-dependent hydrolase